MSAPVTAEDIRNALRVMFGAGTNTAGASHILAFEVADDTGGGSRRLDAMVLACWRSLGHGFTGLEIKISRSDWLREVNSPGKQELFRRCLPRFAVVAPRGVVKAGELPLGWGHYELGERGLRCTVKPSVTPAEKLEPIPPGMLAAFVRRAVVEGQDVQRQAFNREAAGLAPDALAARVAELEQELRKVRLAEGLLADLKRRVSGARYGASTEEIETELQRWLRVLDSLRSGGESTRRVSGAIHSLQLTLEMQLQSTRELAAMLQRHEAIPIVDTAATPLEGA